MDEIPSRKLAVLLHADVVDSTGLVRKNETLAHRRIQETFRCFSETIKNHGGTAHEIRGDALVAEFSRASDAVCAAIAFQDENTKLNASLKDALQPQLRIGIAMGEVVIADNTITGDGIVLAQRLEQLAEPGAVCIQGAAYETVPRRLPFDYENLGEQILKGFDEPIRVYKVRLRADAVVPPPEISELEHAALELPDKPSIAVLPFTNMSDAPEQEYFSDGITEDIITELSRFSSMFVIARHSSFVFKGQMVDVKEVGEKLGVKYVIEGSVRKAGERVRITAQLVEAKSGNHVWAQRYDRELSDIFSVQDEVTRLIVGTVAGRVDASEAQRVAWKPPNNITAYDLLLRGLQQFKLQARESLARARELFREALKLDADYARVYAYLAFTHVCDVWYAYSDIESMHAAVDLAQKAVVLDPDDTFAQAVHGLVLFFLGREDEGISKLERSLELNPNDAEVLHWLGFILPFVGRAGDGADYIREATRLNPFNVEYDNALGIALYHSGQFEESAEVLKKYADTDWRFTIAYLAGAYAQLGRMGEARSLLNRSLVLRQQELRKRGDPIPDRDFTLVFEEWELARWPEACERLLAGLRKTDSSS